MAKLKTHQIIEMRALRTQGMLLRELADRYQVSISTAHHKTADIKGPSWWGSITPRTCKWCGHHINEKNPDRTYD